MQETGIQPNAHILSVVAAVERRRMYEQGHRAAN
jgi:hypothetical protein